MDATDAFGNFTSASGAVNVCLGGSALGTTLSGTLQQALDANGRATFAALQSSAPGSNLTLYAAADNPDLPATQVWAARAPQTAVGRLCLRC